MNKQKLIGTFIGIILFIVAIAGLSYAYVSWTSENMNKIVSSRCFDILYTKGQDITGPIMPSKSYLGGETSTFKLNIKKSCNINAKGKLYLNTSEDTSENLYREGLLNYYVTKGNKFIAKGNITSSGEIEIDLGFLEAKDSATTNYTVYVWIDDNLVQNSDAFSSYGGNIRVEVVQTQKGPTTNVNLLTHITNLYTSKGPEPIEHKDPEGNKIADYYYSYQDDSKTWGLMNDGLKIDTSLDATTTGFATTITDPTALTNGTEGNIRYFGPSDKVNNYIYFNCSDYSNQSDSTCEKWRIIGIVDGKVKLIKEESIGNLAWDQDKNQNENLTTYNNNWTSSSLQEFLNGLYYNRGENETHTYYSGDDGSTTTTLDLKTIGITEATRNNNLISESTWYLGGYDSTSIYPNQIYAYERQYKKGAPIYSTNDFTTNANIGLMYTSDYGYGTDLTQCSKKLQEYGNIINPHACGTNNWLLNYQSLITPTTMSSSLVWSATSYGFVVNTTLANNAISIHPVLYLNENVIINNKGAGTSDNPYQIYVETEPVKLSDYIINLYTNGYQELITHQDTAGKKIADYYYSYQGKDWGLMNDGLKVSPDSSVGATTIDDETILKNGTEGNIRYFGPSNKVNNYIYFNCSDYSNQTASTCEKWRIIGIVDGKVKLIRNSSIGNYSWDNKNTTTGALDNYGSNNWANARLMKLLNPDYDNEGVGGSLYWNSGSGTCYSGQNNGTKTCDFTSTGIKNNTTKNMISDSTWYLGGYNTAEGIYPNQIYTYERKNDIWAIYGDNPYTINAKIGLMYPSDYGYGTNLTKCNRNLHWYDDDQPFNEEYPISSACKVNNWLFNSAFQWLITPNSSDSSCVWFVGSSGYVGYVFNSAYDAYGVRPVLYLDSELTIESEGEGTSIDPYRIIAR